MDDFVKEPVVIYEDGNLVALNKPAGLLVHSVAGGKKRGGRGRGGETEMPVPTLVDWLIARYPELRMVGDDPSVRPGIVHRLDRDTSGVMVVAKTQLYFKYLKSLFASRAVRKMYLAVVFGKMSPARGRVERPIGIVAGSVRRSTRSEKMRKVAVTEYKMQKEIKIGRDDFSGLEVMPLTGRTHQIRVHLASIGHPVVGDTLYSKRTQPTWAKRLMLHALSLEFPATNKGNVRLEAEPPAEFARFF